MAVPRSRRRLGAMVLAGLCLIAGTALAAPATAQQDPTPADCLATGATLMNGGFEDPSLPGMGISFLPAEDGLPPWETTDTQFEVWGGGYGNVDPAEGEQFVELNATVASTLFQTVPTTPGSLIVWQLAHRARHSGGLPGSNLDVMEVLIGPDFGSVVAQGQYSDNDLAWGYHGGTYAVPPGQTSTTFAFRAVSTSSGIPSAGNFLDDISFATAPCLVVDTSIADDNGGSVQRGDVLTITTTVQNHGFSAATDAWISAAVPAQTSYLPGTLVAQGAPVTDPAGDDQGEIAGSALAWRVGSGAGPAVGGVLPPGATATVSFQVVVDAAATGTIASTSAADAQWPGSGALGTSTSNTAIVPLASADLSTTKTVAAANAGSVIAGAPLAFDIVTANAGPGEARDVVVTDALPAGLLAPTATAGPGGACVIAAALATCTYPALPAGASVTTRIAGTLDPATPAGAAVANTASSLARTEDPDLADNVSSVSTGPASVVADLAASIRFAGDRPDGSAAGPIDLAAGGPVRLSAQVANAGPSISPGSTVVITLDPSVRAWTAALSVPGSCLSFGSRVICTLGALLPGEAVQVSLAGVLGSGAPAGESDLVASVVVTGASAVDPAPANNGASAVQRVRVAAAADLGTTAVLTTPVRPGQPVGYVVSTSNGGPSDAAPVVVTIVVPDGVADPVGIADPAISGGACVTVGRTVTCTYPVVRPGVVVRTTVTGTAAPGLTLAAALELRASSRSATPDPSGSNDAAFASASAGALVTAGSLASTGADPRGAAALGAAAVALGAVMLAGSSLRRRDPDHTWELHSLRGR